MTNQTHILKDPYIISRLKETPFPPEVLYVRGGFAAPHYKSTSILMNQNMSHHKIITIVGSRNCSQYSKQVIDEICKSLEGQPVSIVSGLARGVDTQAHLSALKYNLHTIAVVGSGLDDKVLYPQNNLKLSKNILKSGGALISEYESNARSQIWMFPARNRIMVGISDLVIIIEAKEKSGTLITARLATDYNRDLIVVPNSIYSPFSKGSNELIKQGAYVYTQPEDIFNLLKLDFIKNETETYNATPSEKIIIETIKNESLTTQQIIEKCSPQLSVSEIIQILLNLEIEEVIKRLDGRYTVL